MDWQTLINIGGTAGLSIVGWLFRLSVSDRRELRDKLVAFQIEVAKDYVTHADLREIRDMLVRIEARVFAREAKG